ncbi:MAG: hypothetical protein ABI760_15290 [Ferruginibacter sp.]
MKSFAASILLIPMLAQLGSGYLLILKYEVNKDYITKTLCVSRSKPMSGCNGKCYLKKQLAKTAKEENAPNSNTRVDTNELFIMEFKKVTTSFFAEEINNQFIPGKQPFTPQNLYSIIFHPPQAA